MSYVSDGCTCAVCWKRIVVLANSFKYQGRCIAGKEITLAKEGSLAIGGWVRPISDSSFGELYPHDFQLGTQAEPRLLDIIDVPVTTQADDPLQPENWYIAKGARWRKVGTLPVADVHLLGDDPPELWENGVLGTDRVGSRSLQTDPPDHSICFVHLEYAEIVSIDGRGYRLSFDFKGQHYELRITDPWTLSNFAPRLRGLTTGQVLPLERLSVCLSLGTEFEAHHYKLIAAVILPLTGRKLFTIGHSNRSTGELIGLLEENGVDAVADVRSYPVSLRFPQFSRNALETSLRDAGVDYVFLGNELGARRNSAASGFAPESWYQAVTSAPEFVSGIQRLVAGAERFSIALLCAERDPLLCHRTVMICRKLWNQGIEIGHIIEEGRVEWQPQAESRLMLEENIRPEQVKLFDKDRGYVALDRAYDRRAAKIRSSKGDEELEGLHDWVHAEER